jgi:type I restriction enzyme S subunit
MENNLIPKLRFPEFKKNWENKSFNSLYTFKSTNSFSRENLNYENGEIKNIHYGDIHTKFNTLFDITKEKVPFINSTIDISKIKEDSYVEEGDLIIADASENYDDIGKMIEVVNVNNEKLVAGLHTFLAKRKNSNNAIGFTANLVKTWNVRQQILKIAQGTKVLSLSTGRLGEINLTIPQPEEQQKIATFLTSVDERLTLLVQQKEKLELYKKGVMQQIFSQKLRFKDENGNNYPDWEEKNFNEIIERTSTGLNPRQNFTLGKGNNYYVTIKNISNGKLDFRSCEMIDDDALKLIKKRSDLSKNDIIMSSIGNIGEAYLLKEEPTNWNINESVFMIRSKKEVVMPLFMYYILSNDYTKRYFENNMTGSSFKSIKIGDLKLMPVEIPCLEEQQKIASFLSAIDVQIEGASKKIDQTKMFKKGLLQQMFV